MTLTATGDIEVHQSDDMVLFRGTEAQPQEAAESMAASTDLFPDIYMRIEEDTDPDAVPGTVTLTNLFYWFNDATNTQFDSGRISPIGFSDTSIVIPTGFTGILYFVLQLSPRDQSIEYATELPAPVDNIYARTLADVTRGTGDGVTIRQRCFGVITVPGIQVFDLSQGLF